MNAQLRPRIVWNTSSWLGKTIYFVGRRIRAAFGIPNCSDTASNFVSLDESIVFQTEFSVPGLSKAELRSALEHNLSELSPIRVKDMTCYVRHPHNEVLHLAILAKSEADTLERQYLKSTGFVVGHPRGESGTYTFAHTIEKTRAHWNTRLLTFALFALVGLWGLQFTEIQFKNRADALVSSNTLMRAEILQRVESRARQSDWQKLSATNPEARIPSARLSDVILLKSLTPRDTYWTSLTIRENKYSVSVLSSDAITLLSVIDKGVGKDRRAQFAKPIAVNSEGKQSAQIEVIPIGAATE